MDLIALQTSSKFQDPRITADGQARASVTLRALRTLWINTGTLCNLTCENCYIKSSPSNDALVYISRDEVRTYLDEVAQLQLPVTEIGFTGGEPFMNPDLIGMMGEALARGFDVLVLTNAMRPMMKCVAELLLLHNQYADRLAIRVSVDHFNPRLHTEERGKRSWRLMIKGLRWLSEQGMHLQVAGRRRWGEDEQTLRAGFAALFAELGVNVDAEDPAALTLFPEMDEDADVPEITTACWEILGVSPDAMMCATSRMVVKEKGATPKVMPCTLLPYDSAFDMGPDLASSIGAVPLNHPHCARFCVLGGGSCSAPQ